MLPAAVVVVVLGACAGCGRIGFDDHSPANPDGSSDSDGATDAHSARAKVITARGAIGVSDVAYDAAGRHDACVALYLLLEQTHPAQARRRSAKPRLGLGAALSHAASFHPCLA